MENSNTQLYVPKAITTLSPLLVRPNGTPNTCRVKPLDRENWEDRPTSTLLYYRLATEAEANELLAAA